MLDKKVIVIISVMLLVTLVGLYFAYSSDSDLEIKKNEKIFRLSNINSFSLDQIGIDTISESADVIENGSSFTLDYGEEEIDITLRVVFQDASYCPVPEVIDPVIPDQPIDDGVFGGVEPVPEETEEFYTFDQIIIPTDGRVTYEWKFTPISDQSVEAFVPITPDNFEGLIIIKTKEEYNLDGKRLVNPNRIIDFSDLEREVSRVTHNPDIDDIIEYSIKPQAWNTELTQVNTTYFQIRIILKDGYSLTGSDVIFFDPTITLTDISTLGTVTNVTKENNFSHLSITTTAPYSGINLYMPFDTNTSTTTTYDYSQYSNDGTYQAEARFNNSGLMGGVVLLDGVNDWVDLPDTALTASQNFTIMMWLKVMDSQASGANVYAFGSDFGNRNYIGVTGSSDTWFIRKGSTTVTELTFGYAPNTWIHVALTYNTNTGNVSFYVNGTVIVSAIDTNTNAITDLNLGSFGDGTDSFFNGSIDQIIILNSTRLTDAQILDYYRNSSTIFFPSGEQVFTNINVSSAGTENRINISLNQILNMPGANFTVQIGDVSGASYTYGSTYQIDRTTGNVSNISTATPNNISLKVIFNPHNSSTAFYTPVLQRNIILNSYTVAGAGGAVCPDGSITVNGSTHCANNFTSNSTVGAVAWTNPSNAQLQDNTYATSTLLITQQSNYLRAKNFTWGVPATATIRGIKVELERSADTLSAISDTSVRLMLHNGTIGSDRSNATTWTTSDQLVTYGNATDLWGLPLTPTLLNNSDFGFVISVTGGAAGTAQVDSINMTVYYTTDTCTYSTGNWNVLCSDNCIINTNYNLANNNLTLTGTGIFSILSNITNINYFTKANACTVIKRNGAIVG